MVDAERYAFHQIWYIYQRSLKFNPPGFKSQSKILLSFQLMVSFQTVIIIIIIIRGVNLYLSAKQKLLLTLVTWHISLWWLEWQHWDAGFCNSVLFKRDIIRECSVRKSHCRLFPVRLSLRLLNLKPSWKAHFTVYCGGFIVASLWPSGHCESLHCPLSGFKLRPSVPTRSNHLICQIGRLLYCVVMIVYPSCGSDD